MANRRASWDVQPNRIETLESRVLLSVTVNLADFNLLAGNFGLSAGPDGPTAEDWAALAGLVPKSPGEVWPTPAEWDTLSAAGARNTRFLIRDSTLFVQGTSNADRIVINARTLRQMRQQFAEQSVAKIWVEALDGNDRVVVNVPLPATIMGGLGKDTLIGGAANDSMMGGDGNDLLFGGKGNDSLYGDAGNDVLRGLDGNDMLVSGLGADRVFGGRGDDSFHCSNGLGTPDVIRGEAGFDQILSMDADDRYDLGRQ